MDAIANSLITAFDYVLGPADQPARRADRRGVLLGTGPGVWSLRPGDDGRWRLAGGGGGGPAPDPVPVTTIAWRLGHLGGMALGGFANWRFADGTLTTEQISSGTFTPTDPRCTAEAGGQGGTQNSHGRRLMPLMKLDRRRSGSPAVMPGTRVSSSRSMTVISRRARWAPRQ